MIKERRRRELWGRDVPRSSWWPQEVCGGPGEVTTSSVQSRRWVPNPCPLAASGGSGGLLKNAEVVLPEYSESGGLNETCIQI